MKLTSKEIFPVEARDKLVANVGKIDNGVCDIRVALEWAEAKCQELDKKNKELEVYKTCAINTILKLGDEVDGLKHQICGDDNQ